MLTASEIEGQVVYEVNRQLSILNQKYLNNMKFQNEIWQIEKELLEIDKQISNILKNGKG